MDNFLREIKQKAIYNTPVSGKLADTLQSIAGFARYAFIFDAEFQRVYNQQREMRHILEFGGIMFERDKNKKWFYVGNFHFNLPPASKNTGLIHSTFLTVTPQTQSAMDEIEKDYMLYPKLDALKDHPEEFKKYYYSLLNHPLVKKKRIPKLDPDKEPNKIIKLFKNMLYQLNKYDVGKSAFHGMWKLYLNDPLVKKRTIKPSRKWLLSFKEVLEDSLLIVKGMNDIIAIDNLFDHYKVGKIQDKIQTLDIAVYNGAFRETCKSAELEQSYWCIINNNLTDPEIKPIFKIIYKSLETKDMTAHNPLIDSFYTLVVAVSMHSVLVKNI
jgi:hypothetical protein